MVGRPPRPALGPYTPLFRPWSAAVHTTGFPPTQAPAWQVSVCVQALPSLHGAPSSLAGLLQPPDAGLQTPAVWHWAGAGDTTGVPPTQRSGGRGVGEGWRSPGSPGPLKKKGGVGESGRAGVAK